MKYAKVVAFIGLAAVLFYVPLFLRLDYLPFRAWDEARPAVQAYEMLQTGDYLVTTYRGEPDLWYTKPPLQVWLQVLCIHVFGYGELAIRLPSALAALATGVLLMLFLHRVTRSWRYGFMAALVLFTTAGYVCVHGSRTGDVDVLLAFFLILSACSLYLYAEEKNNPRFLYVFFVGLTGAVLTKGVAGLFLLPAFLLFVLFKKSTRTLIRSGHFYAGLFLFLLFAAGFYVLREQANPGYWQAVWNNELPGRYAATLEGHSHGFFYYAERLATLNHPLWVLLFLLGLSAGGLDRDAGRRRLTGYVFLMFGQYLLLISLSGTKPYWYDVPLYPFWAVIVATGVDAMFRFMQRKWAHQTFLKNTVPYLMVVVVFGLPYRETFRRVSRAGEPEYWHDPFYTLPNHLRFVYNGHKKSLNGWTIAYDEYTGNLMPYVYLLAEKGQHLSVITPDQIQPGQQVFTNLTPVKNDIHSRFVYSVERTEGNITFYRIEAAK